MRNYKEYDNYEEYYQSITDYHEEERMDSCQYLQHIRGRNKEGEEKGELDWCNLSDNPCLLMSGDDCEEWNKIQEVENNG